MEDTLQAWFVREILVLEPALMRYLMRAWPDREEADDLRQDIYIRVYEAAARARPAAPRAFLFTTARHLMTDRVRRGRIVSIELRGDLDELNVLIDEITPERQVRSRQELKRLEQAFEELPPVCREVVWKRKVDALPQKEVARELGLKERVVERTVARGVRLLTAAFFGGQAGLKSSIGHDIEGDEESEHG